MSLDFYLGQDGEEVFARNITHNLGKMAKEAGLYYVLWHPNSVGYHRAKDCIPTLETGLLELLRNKAKYEAFNAPNGWGMYEHLVPFVVAVLTACNEYPDAQISTSV